MTNLIAPPYPLFLDSDGTALDAGQIYIGTAGLDPRASPVGVYWDEAMSIAAAQPIRTLAGYPVYQGSPTNAYVNADVYSLLVQDKNGRQVYFASSTNGNTATAGSVIEQLATVDGQTAFVFAGTNGRAVKLMVNGVRIAAADYTRSGDTITLAVAATAGDILTVDTWGGVSSVKNALANDVAYDAVAIATAGSVAAKLQSLIDPMDVPFGGVGNGIANDTAAVVAADAAAAGAGASMVLTKVHKIASDITLNADIVAMGGRLEPSAGVTVTLRGEVFASEQRVFGTAGAVVGVRDVRPEWWGALSNGTADNIVALRAAHTCVQASQASRGGRQTIRLSGGAYGVSDGWLVEPTANVNLHIVGSGTIFGGTRITDLASYTSTANPVFQIGGNADSIQQITDWGVTGVAIIKGAGSAVVGFQVGSNDPTKKLIGQTWQKVEDVFVEGFTFDLRVIHSRQIVFSRVSAWSNNLATATVPLQITTNGWFTGDLIFDDACQFVSNSATLASTKCIQILCETGDYNNATGANQIAGIVFGNLDCYQGQRALEVYCRNGGYISDIWARSTQFDQQTTNAIWIEANKDSATAPVIQNVNIVDAYFSANLGATIALVSTAGGIVREVDISSNFNNGGQKEFVKVSGAGVENITINGNRVVNNNNTTGYVIDLGAANIASACGNKLSRTDGASFPDYMVNIGLGANNYVVRDNISAGLAATGIVLDNGGAVTKSVGGNI